MITNINSFRNMEQFFNTGWFIANITALWIGLRTKLIILQTKIYWVEPDTLRYAALIIGIVSSLIFLGYNLSKWYQQILETKEYKKKKRIEKLFKFTEDNKNKE